MHRYAEAYQRGRNDYPNEPNPYDDHTQAHMWRLGWLQSQREKEERS